MCVSWSVNNVPSASLSQSIIAWKPGGGGGHSHWLEHVLSRADRVCFWQFLCQKGYAFQSCASKGMGFIHKITDIMRVCCNWFRKSIFAMYHV